MATTVEGVEEITLKEAQKLLGTKPNRDTVNAALLDRVRKDAWR